MGRIKEMYDKSWEKNLRFMRVQDQSTYFGENIGIGIDVVMRFRSESWW